MAIEAQPSMFTAVVARHTLKPNENNVESSRYPGLSEAGVQLVQQQVEAQFLPTIRNSPDNAVFFIGGASDAIRTVSTAEIYGDRLQSLLAGTPGTEVVTRSNISTSTKEIGVKETVNSIRTRLTENPNTRFVIDSPLFLKELSLKSTGIVTIDENGKEHDTPYLAELAQQNNNDEIATLRQWFSEGDQSVNNPKPSEVAQGYLTALDRLHTFARRYVGERPLTIVMVGHGYALDALLTYCAGGGQVSGEAFDQVSQVDGAIRNAEATSITVTGSEIVMEYRGNSYVLLRDRVNKNTSS